MSFDMPAVGNATVEFYAKLCERASPAVVLAGMTGGLAACAMAAGMPRANFIAALNSAFDDIEGVEGD